MTSPHAIHHRFATMAVVILCAILCALGACSSSPPTASPDGSADAAADLARDTAGEGDWIVDLVAEAAPEDAALADAATSTDLSQTDAKKVWPPPPGSYDCTSVAAGPPGRVNKVPLGCVLDPTCTTTLVTGHRGVGTDSQQILGLYIPIGRFAPENTLSSVRAAIVMGADIVEVDVRTTKDGHLVLVHDDDVARTTKGKGSVSTMTLAQLQALKLKTAQFKGDFSCERVPTFDEVLKLTKGKINIDADLKTDATDKVALAVKQAGMIDQVFMSAASTGKLVKARTAVPTIRLQARTDDAKQVPALLSMFTPPPEIIEIDEKILTAATIAVIHAGGAKVFVDGFFYDAQGYLTNDPKVYQPLVGKQPDVIQVDRIDLLLQLLGR